MGGPVVKKHNSRSATSKESTSDTLKKGAIRKTPRKKQRAEAPAKVEDVEQVADISTDVTLNEEKKTPRKKKREGPATKEEEVTKDSVNEAVKKESKTPRKNKRAGSEVKASTEEKASRKKKRVEPAKKEEAEVMEKTTNKKKGDKHEKKQDKNEGAVQDENVADDKQEKESTLFAPVQVDEETVSGAVKALLKQYAAKYAPKDDGSDSAPIRLVNEHDRVSLVYQMQAAPAKQRLLPKRVVLPYAPRALDGMSVCIFTRDPVEDVSDKLRVKPVVEGVKMTVMGLKQVKKEYATHERRRALGAEHQLFLADERVAPSLVHHLGKWFVKAKRLPMCVHVDGSAATARADVERALRSAAVHTPKGTSASVQVGHAAQNASELTANVMAACARAAQLLGGEVTAVYITAHGLPALPIYVGQAHTLRAPAAPPVDDIDAVIEKYKLEELM